jgi:V/A-type H+-transporting ATPase subunit A
MNAERSGRIIEINGPILRISLPGARNGEQIRIGSLDIIGEIIALEDDVAIVQAYETTEGLRPGERVEGLGHPLTVELGPGLLQGIYDGVQRPLQEIARVAGDNIPRGLHVNSLDRERKWVFLPCDGLEPGMTVRPGEMLGAVQETETIEHRIPVPPNMQGELIDLAEVGSYTLEDTIARVRDEQGKVQKLKMYHRWPVRIPRPYRQRDHGVEPLITGQRILDTFFPLLKGGKGAVPGPFGAGKTMVQQQVARWSNADIVIYVGCGERGNEMVDVLESFPQLQDPHTGRGMMERTLLVANTSNMPVVAREASIYVGMTIAEYFRDQGYDVVMLADSTSRWAEALREVAGRLGHMPVEEGYPAYLGSRLAAVYERAGRVQTLEGERGSVTLIGAVSPPGGDFSEPVTSHTKEIIQTFWALSKELADARHYPSVDWVDSFSADVPVAASWWAQNIGGAWDKRRGEALALLARDAELSRIVNLVGPEALSHEQRWELEGASLIKEAILQQSALDDADSYCSPRKQFELLELVMQVFERGKKLIELGAPVQELAEHPLMARIRRAKSTWRSDEVDELADFANEVYDTLASMHSEYASSQEAAS